MTAPAVDAFSLTRLFIAPGDIAAPSPTLGQDWVGATMTAWDPVSYANLVQVGPILYQNLPVVSPNGLTLGLVLLAKTPGGYIIMGNLGSVRNPGLLDPIRYRYLAGDISLPNTTFADAGVLNFQLNTNTAYGIDGGLSFISTTSNDIKFAWSGPINMSAKFSMFGLNNSTTHSILSDTVTGYGDANPQTIQGLGGASTCRPWAWFGTTDTPGLLQLRVALDSGSTAGTLQQGSWLRISELGNFGGATTIIKHYPLTASRSYDDSGTYIGATDGDNNVYMGEFPDRSFGNERSLMIFDGATIRSDLAGATILSAQLFMYCIKAEETKGSLQILPETYTVLPTTYTPATASGFGVNDLWTVPSWNSVECLYTGGASSWLNEILAGKNALGLTPTSLGRAATGFHGFGFDTDHRPYLEVVYSI